MSEKSDLVVDEGRPTIEETLDNTIGQIVPNDEHFLEEDMTEQHSSSARALTETKLPRLQKLARPIFLQRPGSKVS